MLPVRYDDETLKEYQQRVGEDVYPSNSKMKPPKVKREPEVEEVLEEPDEE